MQVRISVSVMCNGVVVSFGVRGGGVWGVRGVRGEVDNTAMPLGVSRYGNWKTLALISLRLELAAVFMPSAAYLWPPSWPHVDR